MMFRVQQTIGSAIGVAACALLTGTAFAQTVVPESVAAPNPVRWVMQTNITLGGDKLYSGNYSNGDSFSIRAGQMLQLGGGIDYRLSPDWSIQALVSYHYDSTNATNGDLSFRRMPVELLALYQVTPNVRIGGGFRKAMGAKSRASGMVSNIGDSSFNSSTGVIVEVEYLVGNSGNIALVGRYVSENFTASGSTKKMDGSHVGLGFKGYF